MSELRAIRLEGGAHGHGGRDCRSGFGPSRAGCRGSRRISDGAYPMVSDAVRGSPACLRPAGRRNPRSSRSRSPDRQQLIRGGRSIVRQDPELGGAAHAHAFAWAMQDSQDQEALQPRINRSGSRSPRRFHARRINQPRPAGHPRPVDIAEDPLADSHKEPVACERGSGRHTPSRSPFSAPALDELSIPSGPPLRHPSGCHPTLLGAMGRSIAFNLRG
jgi:hypothetical protein